MGERSRRNRGRTSRELEASSSAATPVADDRAAWIVLAIALALIVLAYANGTRGEFVYDDQKQIVGNALIQHPEYLGKALSSDVWAFTGDEAKNWSNYWRPLFIAWLALHHALFGLDPTPWHVSNIVLHFLATALGYFVLRSLGARGEIAAIATWFFAAHPA